MKFKSIFKITILSALLIPISNIAFASNDSKITIENLNYKYSNCMKASPSAKGVNLCGMDSVCRVTNLVRYFEKEAHNLSCINKYGGPELIYYYSDKKSEI